MNKIFDNQNLKKNLTVFLKQVVQKKLENVRIDQKNSTQIANSQIVNNSLEGFLPELLIIQIGDNLASTKYASLKVKIGQKIGIKVTYYQYKMNGEIWKNGEFWQSLEFEKTKNEKYLQIKSITDHIKEKIQQNVNKARINGIKNGLIFQLPLPNEFCDLLEINWQDFIDVDFLASNCDLWGKNLLPPTIQAIDLVLKSLIWQENTKIDLQNTAKNNSQIENSSNLKISKKTLQNQEKTTTENYAENLDIQIDLIQSLLTRELDLTGKIVAVIGQGKLVGNPLLKYLQRRNATIISLNKDTPNKPNLTQTADILICASGVPGLVKTDWLKKNAIVIDAATSESNGVLVGDVDYSQIDQNENQTNETKNFVQDANRKSSNSLNLQICPSPGGVGPLTVLCIFWNLISF